MEQRHYKRTKKKHDEYWTLYEHVEKLAHYFKFAEHVRGKKVWLPCDTEESSFTKYFIANKLELGYAELRYTSDDLFTHEDIRDWADVVITNPPFSKFGKIVDFLMEKDGIEIFLFGGIMNVISMYKYLVDRRLYYYANIRIANSYCFNFYDKVNDVEFVIPFGYFTTWRDEDVMQLIESKKRPIGSRKWKGQMLDYDGRMIKRYKYCAEIEPDNDDWFYTTAQLLQAPYIDKFEFKWERFYWDGFGYSRQMILARWKR